MATYLENSCSFGLRYVSWYKCLIVSLVFSHLGFWSGNLFLIAPFPDLCLLVPFFRETFVELKITISLLSVDNKNEMPVSMINAIKSDFNHFQKFNKHKLLYKSVGRIHFFRSILEGNAKTRTNAVGWLSLV